MTDAARKTVTAGRVAVTGVRERRRARTREDIEAAALGLFLERGYDATTTEEIAEAALISPRTFFRYFASKEDVLLARGRDEMTLAARSLAERPPEEPLMDSLRELLRIFARLHSTDRERQLCRIQLVTTTPHLAAAFLEMLHGMEQVLRDFVAVRLGLETSDRRPRLVAAAFGTAFRVAAETWHDSDGAEDMTLLVRENVETLVAPLLDGAPEPGAGPGP
jgi:AcrR family transcriptional regulator